MFYFCCFFFISIVCYNFSGLEVIEVCFFLGVCEDYIKVLVDSVFVLIEYSSIRVGNRDLK